MDLIKVGYPKTLLTACFTSYVLFIVTAATLFSHRQQSTQVWKKIPW